jgi:hypothetical protein
MKTCAPPSKRKRVEENDRSSSGDLSFHASSGTFDFLQSNDFHFSFDSAFPCFPIANGYPVNNENRHDNPDQSQPLQSHISHPHLPSHQSGQIQYQNHQSQFPFLQSQPSSHPLSNTIDPPATFPLPSSTPLPPPQLSPLTHELPHYNEAQISLTFEEGHSAEFCHQELTTIQSFVGEIGSMDVVHSSLIQFFQQNDLSQRQVINSTISHLMNSIHRHHDTLNNLFTSFVFSPHGIHLITTLKQTLSTKLAQLNVWKNLINFSEQRHISSIFCADLVITSQPFPQVIAKGKTSDICYIDLSLIIGGGVNILSCSPLQIEFFIIEPNGDLTNDNGQITLEEPPPNVTLQTLMNGLKIPLRFATGSRRNILCCRFTTVLTYLLDDTRHTMNISSSLTEPFIIITNEAQWDECEGDLMALQLFCKRTEGSQTKWPHFVNAVQRFLIRATRQSLSSPSCFLSLISLKMLHLRFFAVKPQIPYEEFIIFWRWFGKTVHKLRYQRHLCSLWLCGFLHIILARDVVNEILIPHQPGVFLVRFSESNPGALVISYKLDDPNPSQCIRHYLVSNADLSGAKKTLPDFLDSHSSLSYLYQQIVGMDGNFSSRFHPKKAALDPYISKRGNSAENVGDYDERIR